MKKLILLLILYFYTAQLFLTAQTVMDGQNFAAYEILIEMNDTLTRAQVIEFFNENGLVIRKSFKYLKNTFVVRFQGKENLDKEIAKTNEEKQIVIDLIIKLRKSDKVVNAEPNFKIFIESQGTSTRIPPKDTNYSKNWGLVKIKAPEAWAKSTKCDLKIGIIDTGTDIDHVDLKDNIWKNPMEEPGDANNDGFPGVMGVDDDGDGLIDEDSQGLQPGEPGYSNDLIFDDDENGYPDDFHGWNFTSGTNDVSPYNPHGTHCAGIIGATGKNTTGATGVIWDVKIVTMPVMLSGFSTSLISDIMEAFEYAKTNGIQIISNSWHCIYDSRILYNLMESLGEGENGILFFFAAMNSAFDNDITPAIPSSYDLDNMIVVAASDINDSLTFFSNYGLQSVDIAAPGLHIYSTFWEKNDTVSYQYLSGTSMATPFVAGAAGLIWSQVPDSSWRHIKSILLASVDTKQQLSDKILSGGRLNLEKAINLVDGQNAPPIVDAGPSIRIPRDSLNVVLNGTVSDNTTIPGISLNSTWKKERGPGDVTFEDQSSPSTRVWFSEPGRYTLRLTSTDGEFQSTDLVVVHISAFEHIGDIYSDYWFHNIEVEGNFLYVTLLDFFGTAIRIYDVSDPSNPIERGTSFWDTYLYTNLDVQGNYVYVHGDVIGLNIFDVSDKDSLVKVGNLDIRANLNSLQVIDNMAYLWDIRNGFITIDVTDKTNPKKVGKIKIYGMSHAEVLGKTAYLSAGSNLFVYDISIPGNPLLLKKFSIDSKIITFSVQYPYVILTTIDDLRILNIEKDQPIQMYNTSHGEIIHITRQGNLLLCSDKVKLQLYDISNKKHINTIDNFGIFDIHNTIIKGDIVYGISQLEKRIYALRLSRINTVPYVYAGIDQIVRINKTANLNGFVEDDQFPVGSSLELNWEKLNGTGNVIFNDVNQAVTSATFDQTMTYKLQLSADDGSGELISDTINIIVHDNIAPEVINPLSDRTIYFRETIKVDISNVFTDPDSPTLTYSTTESNDYLDVNVVNTTIEITANKLLSNYSTEIIVLANDGINIVRDTFNVTIEPYNHPYLIKSVETQYLTIGETFAISLNDVYDYLDNDYLILKAQSSNSAIATTSLSEDNNLIVKAISEGTATVLLTVTDPGVDSRQNSFEVVVTKINEPPYLVSEINIPVLSVDGPNYTIDISDYFADPEGEALTFTAESEDADVAEIWLEFGTSTVVIQPKGIGNDTTQLILRVYDPLENEFEYSTMVVVTHVLEVTNQISDYTNVTLHPNPMVNSTTIEFTLTTNAHVKAVLCNSLGQQIDIIFNDNLNKGVNTVIVENNNYYSGVYYIKLETANFAIVKPLLIK